MRVSDLDGGDEVLSGDDHLTLPVVGLGVVPLLIEVAAQIEFGDDRARGAGGPQQPPADEPFHIAHAHAAHELSGVLDRDRDTVRHGEPATGGDPPGVVDDESGSGQTRQPRRGGGAQVVEGPGV